LKIKPYRLSIGVSSPYRALYVRNPRTAYGEGLRRDRTMIRATPRPPVAACFVSTIERPSSGSRSRDTVCGGAARRHPRRADLRMCAECAAAVSVCYCCLLTRRAWIEPTCSAPSGLDIAGDVADVPCVSQRHAPGFSMRAPRMLDEYAPNRYLVWRFCVGALASGRY
jgi:hypothetical protein